MAELCFPSTSRPHLSGLLKSDFLLFCSFVFSHPLHFMFLICFSLYFHKLLSFLFPLFLTTCLFLLAFLTFVPNFISEKQSSEESKVSFLSATYRAIVEVLRSRIDNRREEYLRLEDFEVFRVVFSDPTFPVESSSSSEEEDFSLSPDEGFTSKTELDGFSELIEKSNRGRAMDDDDGDKKLGSLWEDLDDSEGVKVTTGVEKTKIARLCTEVDKATEKLGEKKSQGSNGSEAEEETGEKDDKIRRNDSVGKEKYYKSKLLKAHSHSIGAGAGADYTDDDDYTLKIQCSPSLDYSYGSMRKEKEWKRTLACKLFEERNNGGESEGMDLLWEAYETESGKNKNGGGTKQRKNKNKHDEIKKKHPEEDEKGHDEEDDSSDGQLCCLQALKFSTGKMNLGMGMGKPNLVKISKAIKGMGWLHGLKKHSKKVHNGDKY